MDLEIINHVKNARAAGVSDDEIRHNLILAGWPQDKVAAALQTDHHFIPRPPLSPSPSSPQMPPVMSPPQSIPESIDINHLHVNRDPIAITNIGTTTPSQSNDPIAVVKSYSNQGFEYFILFFSMWIVAGSLGFIVTDLIASWLNHSSGGTIGKVAFSFAAAAVIVTLPIYSVLFLRLKRAELKNPQLRYDNSRRRAIQLTLIVTFVIGVSDLISYLFVLLNGSNTGFESVSRITSFLDMLVTLVFAGGIFAYYWIDLHKREG